MLSEIGSNFWIDPSVIYDSQKPITPDVFRCTGSDYAWLSTGRSAISLVIETIEERNPKTKKVALITYPLTELSTGYPFVSGIIWAAMNKFDGHEPVNLEHNYCGIYFVTKETAYLKQVFDACEKYPWLYKKNQVSDEPSKIVFNDEDNLNYFIYYSKDERPSIKKLLG